MYKKMALLLVVLLGCASAAQAAPDRVGKWDVGVNVSGNFQTDSDINDGVGVEGSFSYGINSWLAVGFSGGWSGHSIDDATSAGITVHGADMNLFPLFGDIIFRVPTDRAVVPYGVVGLGTVITNVDDTDTSVTGLTVQTDVDTAFAVKLGGGVDWFINENWIFNVQGNYVFYRPDVTETASISGVSISATDNLKFDYWNVGAGLKFVF